MNRIKQELYALSGDIHECLSSLVKARLDKDTEAEARAIDNMERLLASTQHVCSYVIDELPENTVEAEVDGRIASDEYDIFYYKVKYPIHKCPYRIGDRVKLTITPLA